MKGVTKGDSILFIYRLNVSVSVQITTCSKGANCSQIMHSEIHDLELTAAVNNFTSLADE